ncbi:MAG: hypothetical protein EBX40_01770 [Gammaproteobacteria bacterium]|nr:hypothetical protein [Gammaproteobacteria bacterium]
MKKLSVILVAAALSSAGVAFADQTMASNSTSATSGVYVGILAGYGKVYQSGYDKSGFTYGANLGYLFTQNVGLELGAQHAPNNDMSGNKVNQVYNVHLAVVGMAPVTGGFDVYGKFGPAYAHSNVSAGDGLGTHSKAVVYGAAGLGYSLNQNFGLSLEGDLTTQNGYVPAMYSVNVGASYMF